jgi:hypothetical protein
LGLWKNEPKAIEALKECRCHLVQLFREQLESAPKERLATPPKTGDPKVKNAFPHWSPSDRPRRKPRTTPPDPAPPVGPETTGRRRRPRTVARPIGRRWRTRWRAFARWFRRK